MFCKKMVILVCLLFLGCAGVPQDNENTTTTKNSNYYETRYDNVLRVFMHLPNQFSILVDNEVIPLYGNSEWNGCGGKIIRDVSKNEPMYVVVKWRYSPAGNCRVILDVLIHVHSASDVNGAGWDDGTKFHRQGTTTVID